jgi:hypothetical protein
MGLHLCRSRSWVEVDEATSLAADDPIVSSDTVQSIARAKESCELRRFAKVTDDGFSLRASIDHGGGFRKTDLRTAQGAMQAFEIA